MNLANKSNTLGQDRYIPPGRRTRSRQSNTSSRPASLDVNEEAAFPTLQSRVSKPRSDTNIVTLNGFASKAALQGSASEEELVQTPPCCELETLPLKRDADGVDRIPGKSEYREAAVRFLRKEQAKRDEDIYWLGPHSKWFTHEDLFDRLEDPDIIEPWMRDADGNLDVDELCHLE